MKRKFVFKVSENIVVRAENLREAAQEAKRMLHSSAVLELCCSPYGEIEKDEE